MDGVNVPAWAVTFLVCDCADVPIGRAGLTRRFELPLPATTRPSAFGMWRDALRLDGIITNWP
jgi:hypothetical protein